MNKLKVFEIEALSERIYKEIKEENERISKEEVRKFLDLNLDIKKEVERIDEISRIISKLVDEKNSLNYSISSKLPSNLNLSVGGGNNITLNDGVKYFRLERDIKNEIVVGNIEGNVEELIESIKSKYIVKVV